MTPELTTEWLADWSFRCGQWAEKVDQYCKDVQELTRQMAQGTESDVRPDDDSLVREMRDDNTAAGHIAFDEKAIHPDQRTLF
jgi:hypothetical protein